MDPALAEDDDADDESYPRLTATQWSAQVIVPGAPVSGWTLVHPYASLDGELKMRHMKPESTVRDVIKAISAMTIKEGGNAIADRVYFEGLKNLGGGIVHTRIGS
jgi:hypothetical protein